MVKVAILDAGSQYWKKIDQKVRRNNVEAEIYPIDTHISQIAESVEAIIISGWPESVSWWNFTPKIQKVVDAVLKILKLGPPRVDKSVLDSWKPILWICYGFQLLNYLAWWKVKKTDVREDWPVKIEVIKNNSRLFEWTPKDQEVLMAHGDSITNDTVWEWFDVSAISENDFVAAIEYTKRKVYWVQFHPETDITEYGNDIISNFLDIAWIERDFTIQDRKKRQLSI